MAVTSGLYQNCIPALANKEIDLGSDTIKWMGTTSAHTINPAHDYKNDITNEVTGTGYTAGGDTTVCTVALVQANSWQVARADSTNYAKGDIVRPATGNGFLYMCIDEGTSGVGVPSYPTALGGTVADGGVIWLCVAVAGVQFDAEDPLWTPSTLIIRQLHCYDSTPGTDATRPLIGWIDLGADVSSTNDDWTYQVDPRGFAHFLLPF